MGADGLIAHTMVSHFVDHLPYDRMESINACSNVHTPRSTLASWSGQCGAALIPLYDAHRRCRRHGWLWGAIALSLALQVAVVHLGLLNVAFGTAPLTPGQWLLRVAMASAVLWYSELHKGVSHLMRA